MKFLISAILVSWLLLPNGIISKKQVIKSLVRQKAHSAVEIPEQSTFTKYVNFPAPVPVVLKQGQEHHPKLLDDCSLGTGLKPQTYDILSLYNHQGGLIITVSSEVAEIYFSELGGFIRSLGGPSLESLRIKTERASVSALPYETIAYGLETNKSTPEEEWMNLIESTSSAAAIADQYDKLLLMGPGFRLMSENEDQYAPMAAMADIWLIQTQQLQREPPGLAYREEVQRVINLIRSGNPDIQIFAQITFTPDQEPDIDEWLAYHRLISDIVDGVYIGVFSWDTVSNEVLISAIDTIFTAVCGEAYLSNVFLPTVMQ